jgi:hypothetical protein
MRGQDGFHASCVPMASVLAERLVALVDDLACLRVDDAFVIAVTEAVDRALDDVHASGLLEERADAGHALGDRALEARPAMLEAHGDVRADSRRKGHGVEARRRPALRAWAARPVGEIVPVYASRRHSATSRPTFRITVRFCAIGARGFEPPSTPGFRSDSLVVEASNVGRRP